MTCNAWFRFNNLRRIQSMALTLAVVIGLGGATRIAFTQKIPYLLQPNAPTTKQAPPLSSADQQRAAQIVAGLPMLFEKNEGQTSADVSFFSRSGQYDFFLTSQQAILSQHGGKTPVTPLRMQWLGANSSATAEGDEQIPAKTNYFIGNEKTKWHSGVVNYQRVKYSALYPGIDLVYYGNEQKLEYDLTVAPEADPQPIHLHFDGASRLRLDKATGDLIVRQKGGEIRFRKPVVYQPSGQPNGDIKLNIEGKYVLEAHNTISFALGNYDHSKQLVIDPYVVYSTAFGGSTPSGSYSLFDYFRGMAVDSSGSVYILGETGTTNVPTTPGAYQPSCNKVNNNCSNFFVGKFDTTKSGAASLVYATYLGGSEGNITNVAGDPGFSSTQVAVDVNGNAYIAVASSTNNYPTTSNGYSASCGWGGGANCFGMVFSKLDPTGSTLLYSSYFPGTYVNFGANNPNNYWGTGFPNSIAVDANQIVYMGGNFSNGLVTTDGSTCGTLSLNCYNAFVAAFDTKKSGANSLVYSRYLPLYANPGIFALTADPSGDVYLEGAFDSQENPNTMYVSATPLTLNGYLTSAGYSAGIGPVLVRLNPQGNETYATYLETQTTNTYNGNYYSSVSADANGIAYTVLHANGAQTQLNGLAATAGYTGYGSYFAKYDTTQTGSASLLYSTYLTTTDYGSDYTYAITNNAAGLMAFAGTFNDLPTTNIYVNPLYEPTNNSTTAYAGIIDTTKSGDSALTFLSLVNAVETPYSVAFDPSNNLLVGGMAYVYGANSGFLAVPASFATSEGNTNDAAFFYKISFASSQLNVSPSSLAFRNQVQNTTSTSQPVTVTNTGQAPITFSSITPTAPFGETDNCSPSLAAYSSCTINVTFTPTSIAADTGTLTLNDNDISLYQTVSLSGTGIAGTPVASISPTSVPFGNQVIHTTSNATQVTLTNTGTAALTGIAISITGSNASSFGLSNGCGTTLAINASCTMTVNFTPSSVASYSASLSFSDNASPSTQSVALTGAGIAAPTYAVTLSPSYLNFSGPIGSATAAQPVTLTNTGTGTVSITGITYTKTVFATSSTTCGATLAANSSCTIYVTATPTAGGSTYAYLYVADNAGGSPQGTQLTVNAPYPLALGGIDAPSYTVYATNLSVYGGQIIVYASGGTPPYTFTDSFPAGSGTWTQSSLYGTGVSIDGAPLYPGTINFSITVTDSLGATVTGSSSFPVYQLLPTTTFNATQTLVPGGTNLSFYISEVPPATSITPATPTGTITYYVDQSGTANTPTLTNGITPTASQSFDILYHSITAYYSGDTYYYGGFSFAPTVYAINGNRPQIISFSGGLSAPVGSTTALTAHASSGLPITYTVLSGPAIIDQTGTNLVTNGTGTVTVEADQSGDNNFAAANSATANFTAY
jgi:hypothetical protein